MSNELIKIINNNGNQLVSGNELHVFLEVGTKFGDWIKGRITKYGFVENEDFTLVTEKKATNNPKNPTTIFTDYIITTDMAKELSMAENNAKGKEARQYFIACEKQLKIIQFNLPKTFKEALLMLAAAEDEKEQLLLVSAQQQVQIQADAPMVKLAKKRLSKDGIATITDVNKTFGLIRGKMIGWAKANAYLHKTSTEINKKGDPYFKLYDNDGFKAIGVTELGLTLINDNLVDINAYIKPSI